jgi:hypothetical protein
LLLHLLLHLFIHLLAYLLAYLLVHLLLLHHCHTIDRHGLLHLLHGLDGHLVHHLAEHGVAHHLAHLRLLLLGLHDDGCDCVGLVVLGHEKLIIPQYGTEYSAVRLQTCKQQIKRLILIIINIQAKHLILKRKPINRHRLQRLLQNLRLLHINKVILKPYPHIVDRPTLLNDTGHALPILLR